MIPVSIIIGDGVANAIYNFTGNIGFRVIYAIVFISMMMDDLGIPNVKSMVKKWLKKKRETPPLNTSLSRALLAHHVVNILKKHRQVVATRR